MTDLTLDATTYQQMDVFYLWDPVSASQGLGRRLWHIGGAWENIPRLTKSELARMENTRIKKKKHMTIITYFS